MSPFRRAAVSREVILFSPIDFMPAVKPLSTPTLHRAWSFCVAEGIHCRSGARILGIPYFACAYYGKKAR